MIGPAKGAITTSEPAQYTVSPPHSIVNSYASDGPILQLDALILPWTLDPGRVFSAWAACRLATEFGITTSAIEKHRTNLRVHCAWGAD
jgi:hypothetical protein